MDDDPKSLCPEELVDAAQRVLFRQGHGTMMSAKAGEPNDSERVTYISNTWIGRRSVRSCWGGSGSQTASNRHRVRQVFESLPATMVWL